jgi:hypothetical protein
MMFQWLTPQVIQWRWLSNGFRPFFRVPKRYQSSLL